MHVLSIIKVRILGKNTSGSEEKDHLLTANKKPRTVNWTNEGMQV
jgi:hypothetical protein